MMMTGQEDLIAKLDKLPHSTLLVGDRGSGQRDVCRAIADKFSLHLVPIPDEVDFPAFKSYVDYEYVDPTLIVINGDAMGVKGLKQNSILKFFEEPSPYIYIVIYTEDLNNLLDTIKTRSYILHMNRYTSDQLEPLITGNKELTLRLCNTPGQVMQANQTDLDKLYKLCYNIINNIGKASYPNALTVSSKIGDDLFLFTRMLGICCVDSGKVNLYKRINEMNRKLWIADITDKKKVVENFITILWRDSHEY